jgi:hypothetical protein
VSVLIEYHHHRIELALRDGVELVLSLNGVPRKRRTRGDAATVYVWTNVELHWEEHHLIEGRWWPETGRLLVTANGTPIRDTHLSADQKARG